MDAFRFSLTDEEKASLKDLVRLRIAARLAGRDPASPRPPTGKLREPHGAFVTLTLRGRLRGCIGHIVGDRPLFETIGDMAEAAAFGDPRFTPLTREEFQDIAIEISVLSPLTPCPDPALVEVGRHGLLVRRGARSGLLLPQVPVEWGWDRETFLDQTCRKAGLEPGCWRHPDTKLSWFEAEVF
ncbi:MAG: AmmeMemoRadiSam system protein A [Solidesulfovibrio sp.]|uniref:AmmeMemoRadiSam system protein A n=1 Tax=Solidesulfovibrio sp. TaxID=2910990 RepID=UPI002B213465|nr:AmmeMemoRadiSam system protein A [Solidesulfovibrio sp.]MEA4855501.1 AmmeMemoRadiSam system protein A [Solidesulfovibrio sp.]